MSYPPPLGERERAIVLVHGAWVGEWSWQPIIEPLRSSGRSVHAVSLTGHGVRRNESGPHVNLSAHVSDVINFVETYDLVDVTLVGHSYGGRVITQAIASLKDRVAALVYLDAHAPVAPDSGQSPERTAAAKENGGMLPFTGYDPDAEMVGGGEGVRWFLDRTMPQSFACLNDPWQADLPVDVRKTFVYAMANQPSRFAQYAEFCQADPVWTYHELDGPHFLMMSHPAEVTDIILDS